MRKPAGFALLRRLVADYRRLQRQVKRLEANERGIRTGLHRAIAALTAIGTAGLHRAPAAPRSARAAAAPSAKQARARKQQGRYLGLLRGLTSTQRVKVKKVRAEHGFDAALKLGATLKRKR